MTTFLVFKMQDAAMEMTAEKGRMALFGMFEYREVPNSWEVVVSAKWITDALRPTLEYVYEKLKAHCTLEEFRAIGRVVLLGTDHPFVKDAIERYPAPYDEGVFPGKVLVRGNFQDGITIDESVVTRAIILVADPKEV